MSAASDAQNADFVGIDQFEGFWTGVSMEVKDVESKIANKEKVTFSFGCRSDPRPILFELQMMFGNHQEGFLSLFFESSHHVMLTSFFLNMEILRNADGRRDVVDRRREGKACFLLGPHQTARIEYTEFYRITPNSNAIWTISMEIKYKRIPAAPILAIGNSRLQEDLLSLLLSSKNTDITFCFDDAKMAAHKVILSARAPYFANMFESGMVEVSSGEVHIKDVEPSVFAGVLHYLYSGVPPNNLAEIAMGLLVAADKYGLDDLKSLCEANVCDHLQANNVVDALIVADRTNCPNLRDKAKVLLRSNIDSLDEEATKKLKDNPNLLFDLAVHFSKM